MKARMRRGMTMIELIVTLLITGLTLTMVYWGIMSIRTFWYTMIDQNTLIQQNRQAVDTIADHLRDAQPCTTSSNSVLSSTGSGSVTYYTDSGSCGTANYSINSGSLVRMDGGTSSVVAPNVSSMSFTYYKQTTYNSASYTPTTTPSAPTATEMPTLAGVTVKVTSTLNGRSVTSSTWVRFRNSPAKLDASGSS